MPLSYEILDLLVPKNENNNSHQINNTRRATKGTYEMISTFGLINCSSVLDI